MFKHWRKNEVDGIIFLLIIGGIVGVSIWRKKVKKAAQDKLFAEQWDFLRGLETKLDEVIRVQEVIVDGITDVEKEVHTLNQGLI